MKIAIITPSTKVLSGVQIFNKNLESTLQSRNHSVSYFSVESLNGAKSYKGYETQIGELFNQENKSRKFDVAVCNGEFGIAVEHPKAINVFHGNYIDYAQATKKFIPDNKYIWRMKMAKMQKKSSDGKYVVSVSNFAVKGLNKSDIDVDKVINLTANPEIFYQKDETRDNTPIAVSLGVYYEKGLDILKKLAQEGLRIKLLGNKKIDSENIENLGIINHEELGDYYRKSLCLIFPSRFEGGGLVTLEALACGCPVVTTPTGYGADIKKEIPEFVVENPENLEDYIREIREIKRDKKKYSRKARSYFEEHHNPEKFKKEWINLIENI